MIIISLSLDKKRETFYLRNDRIQRKSLVKAILEWNIAIWGNREGPRDYHTRWGKSDKYYLYEESKKWYNKIYIRNRLTDIENKFMVTKDWKGTD